MGKGKQPHVDLELARQHGLTDEEFARVQQILGRLPTYTELGVFSVMWSEHCSYKSSRVHLGRFPTSGPEVLQGPGENAGAVAIGDGLAVVFKMESHNHPSFIEPHQGAATGVGGILRDVFTMGARPIAALDALWFGSREHAKTNFLLGGVVGGIAAYGNAFGVPTVGGSTTFDAGYNDNILVNAMAVGLCRADRIFLAAAGGVGNPILYVGSRTGRDGIHGATMASEEFDEASESKRPTVQVGDPFTEKLLMEACMELFQTDAVVGIQDMGAAGLTSSSVEMAGRAGNGIDIDVACVPMREEGMTPYEVLLSESQERMLIVAHAGKESVVRDVFQKWDLQCEVIGRVTDTGHFVVRHGDEIYADIPVGPITDQAPKLKRPLQAPRKKPPALDLEQIPNPSDFGTVLTTFLATPNLASKAWIYGQYDHMVQTNTVVRPGGDAAVVRVKGTGRGIAVTTDCNSRLCLLHPRRGAAAAVAEAARNLVATGARPVALTDCLNFASPERPEVMWQFSEAVDGISEACLALSIPVVSGNVSFYNETDGRPIPPTPAIGMVGLLDDVTTATSIAFKTAGDVVLQVGEGLRSFAGSEYAAALHNIVAGVPPELDFVLEKRTNDFVLDMIGQGLFRSCHDVADGGRAVALAECALAAGPSGLGARVRLPNRAGERADVALFGEGPGSFIASVGASTLAEVERAARAAGVVLERLGTVGGDTLEIEGALRVPVSELAKSWNHFPG